MFTSTAGADLHVIDPKVMDIKTSKIERFEVALTTDYTNSNDFVNAVNDLLKKYMNLIHKRKELSRKLEKGPKTLLHCYRQADQLIASQIKQHQIR